jgi:hypothetical protein
MFDRKQNDPLHTVFPNRIYLRPDVMRWEHVEELRKREAERNSLGMQAKWHQIELFGSTVISLARLILSRPKRRQAK